MINKGRYLLATLTKVDYSKTILSVYRNQTKPLYAQNDVRIECMELYPIILLIESLLNIEHFFICEKNIVIGTIYIQIPQIPGSYITNLFQFGKCLVYRLYARKPRSLHKIWNIILGATSISRAIIFCLQSRFQETHVGTAHTIPFVCATQGWLHLGWSDTLFVALYWGNVWNISRSLILSGLNVFLTAHHMM